MSGGGGVGARLVAPAVDEVMAEAVVGCELVEPILVCSGEGSVVAVDLPPDDMIAADDLGTLG